MSISRFPGRAQIEQAPDLDFDAQRGASTAHITIELSPAGLHVRVAYDGQISGIPAAIGRLEAAGLIELVEKYRAAPAAASQPKPKAQRVTPEYNGAGEACCPKHHKPLKAGQWGLFCPAKDDSTERGYCALRFAE